MLPEDRWAKPKMAEFLRVLAATQQVQAAAKAVGMSRQSAYKLRNRLKGEPFDIAWEAAFQHDYDALHQSALERARPGDAKLGEELLLRHALDAGEDRARNGRR